MESAESTNTVVFYAGDLAHPVLEYNGKLIYLFDTLLPTPAVSHHCIPFGF